MKPGEVCLNVVSSDFDPLSLSALAKADAWFASDAGGGWGNMRLVHPVGDSPEALKAKLAEIKPSHTNLYGDGVPWKLAQEAPEGHFAHDVPIDQWYVDEWGGTVGRIRFDNMPMAGASSAVLYRNYLQKVLDWPATAMQLGVCVGLLDYLAEKFPEVGQSIREQVPAYLLEERHGGGGIGPDIGGQDRNFEALAQSSRLMMIMLSGGAGDGSEGSIDANGLLIVGGPKEWLQWKPRLGVAAVFGSMESDAQTANAFPLFMLTTPGGPVVSFYDPWGDLPVWEMLTAGATAGECARKSGDGRISKCFGDCRIMLPQGVLSAADILRKVDKGELVPAKKITVDPPPPPGLGAVVVWAHYELEDAPDATTDPTQFADITAEFVKLFAAGVFWVYNDGNTAAPQIRTDPFPWKRKKVTAKYKDAADNVFLRTYKQDGKVDPANP